jgi:hypothetical protein
MITAVRAGFVGVGLPTIDGSELRNLWGLIAGSKIAPAFDQTFVC